MGFFWDVKKVIGAQIEPGLVQVMEEGREVLAGAAGEREPVRETRAYQKKLIPK